MAMLNECFKKQNEAEPSIKYVNGEMLYSSKLVGDETGKQHFHVIRDIRSSIRTLTPDVDLAVNISFFGLVFCVEFEMFKGRKRVKRYWLNRKAAELITTGYDIVRRLRLLNKLEELYAENKQLKAQLEMQGHDLLFFQSPNITSRELLESVRLFAVKKDEVQWWQCFLPKHAASFAIQGQLTVFLRKAGVRDILIDTNLLDENGKRVRRAMFNRIDVFKAIEKVFKSFKLVEDDRLKVAAVLERLSGDLRIGNLICA